MSAHPDQYIRLTQWLKFRGVRIHLVLAVVLVFSVALIFLRTTTFEFVNFDDDMYVTDNPHIQQGLTPASLAWAFTNIDYVCWQPLTWLAHMLDWEFFGSRAGLHHLVNVIWHALNAVLLFSWLRNATGACWKSFMVAALFAMHPLAVDSVAWVAERKNVLATFFMLLALISYGAYARSGRRGRLWRTLGLYGASLMAKPMLITFPALLLLVDFWPMGRMALPQDGSWSYRLKSWVRDNRKIFWEKVPFVALTLGYLGFFFFSLSRMNLVADAARVPWGARLANAAVSYVAYLGHVLWPQGLAVYYPFPRSIPLWKTGVCVVVLLLITGAVCRSARRFPWMAVGWLWFVGTLVPVIGLVQGGLWPRMADRWAYVPMIGIVIVVVFGVEALVRRFRVPVYGAGTLALAVLATLSLASCRQVGYWENSITLFQRALAVTEGSALAHDNLGLALALRGRYADAQGHFQEALRLNPGYHKSYHNQGAIYLLKGDLPQAWRYLSKALELNPQSERVHNNLGQICLQWGAVDCAIGHFQAALQLNPGYSSARKNLQQALQLREPGAEGRTAVTKP